MSQPQRYSTSRRIIFMVALVIAGEGVFGLPFVIARVFRPTVLDVFQITNLELGIAFSFYGWVATAAYFPGGPLADRFSARKLMAAALWVTATGGIYYATVPGLNGLNWLFAFWGLSTVLLFWAAMIKATRDWGGEDSQGRAFGILDGGRGLFAAILGSATVAVFAALLPEDVETATLAQRTEALKQVILIFTAVTVAAGVMVWFAVPEGSPVPDPKADTGGKFSTKDVGTVLRNPAVWLQGVIVVAAYTGYKGLDDLGLYARDVFDFDDVQAAQLSTLPLWIRPIAAFAAGYIGDKVGGTRTLAVCFTVVIIGDLVAGLGFLQPNAAWTLMMMTSVTCLAVFGLRGLYFAIFGEAGVSAAMTGTAAGLVSFVGYTPDIFMGPLMGHLTDTYPGAEGHEYLFLVLAGFAAIGLAATLAFAHLARKRAAAEG